MSIVTEFIVCIMCGIVSTSILWIMVSAITIRERLDSLLVETKKLHKGFDDSLAAVYARGVRGGAARDTSWPNGSASR